MAILGFDLDKLRTVCLKYALRVIDLPEAIEELKTVGLDEGKLDIVSAISTLSVTLLSHKLEIAEVEDPRTGGKVLTITNKKDAFPILETAQMFKDDQFLVGLFTKMWLDKVRPGAVTEKSREAFKESTEKMMLKMMKDSLDENETSFDSLPKPIQIEIKKEIEKVLGREISETEIRKGMIAGTQEDVENFKKAMKEGKCKVGGIDMGSFSAVVGDKNGLIN